MTDIEAEIIRAILTKQFSAGFFNIILIDDCLKVSNTIPDRDVYRKLLALHTVYYDQMSPVLRRWLFETCIALFTGNGFQMDVLDPARPFPPVAGMQINVSGEWVKKFIG